MEVVCSVSGWGGWLHSDPETRSEGTTVERSDKPDASAIPGILRRRLNHLGRSVASQLLSSLDDSGQKTGIVYCSRHGDLERTQGILKDLAEDIPVSPMSFSLSVHNAVLGVLSIHAKIKSNISSISAGREPLVPTILEAAGLLASGYERVICMICDGSLPDLYKHNIDVSDFAYAASFVLTKNSGTPIVATRKSDTTPSDDTSSLPEAIKFVDFLGENREEFLAAHNRTLWSIRKN